MNWRILLFGWFSILLAPVSVSQSLPDTASGKHAADRSQLLWQTDAYPSHRFLAVHGKRALLDGYSADGLEFWAYPLQIFDEYRIGFRHESDASTMDGAALLRSIEVAPESETRVYVGPDFVVRERIFVPPDSPAAIIDYSVQSTTPVLITVHFTPSLNLMWPAAIGGQEAHWDGTRNGYTLDEPTHRFAAILASPQAREHDTVENNTLGSRFRRELSLTLHPGGASGDRMHTAEVVIASRTAPGEDAISLAADVTRRKAELERAARARYSSLDLLELETPDPEVNRVFAWSEVALEQAWVCNPQLGCGLVAGYGPSRGERRPQYAWFFAGDALVAVEALMQEGAYPRAREALQFVIKYQDKGNGMLWHELSQSAQYLNWVHDYPYMYVHVDISFQFLDAVAGYMRVTHDRQFLEENWLAIAAAYQYCRTLVSTEDGLPRIPPDKEGGNEQDRLRDELTLSAGWMRAAEGFSFLAREAGQSELAEDAAKAGARARSSIAAEYWDPKTDFWISGHLQSGAAVRDHSSRGVGLLALGIFTHAEAATALDELASPKFITPWGLRSSSETASDYDPNSYAKGSVWATSTGSAAVAFWAEHRPLVAETLWRSLLPWTWLDSPGHLHEVLAGDLYHPERESVPEQIWSSATFVTATVTGLLGLEVQAEEGRLTFAPHLPGEWTTLSVRKLRVGNSQLALQLTRSANQIELLVENKGPAVHMLFAPELLLGAKLGRAVLAGHVVTAKRVSYPEETQAQVEVTLSSGSSRLTLDYSGGALAPHPQAIPVIGASSILPN